MSYLDDFKAKINSRDRDLLGFMSLWEEYCTSDPVDSIELCQILYAIKKSDLAKIFGRYAETALTLFERVAEKEEAYEVLKHIIDLQTTNTPQLGDMIYDTLKKRYSQDEHFNEKIRLIGLNPREDFQGALSNYELLSHFGKKKFLFHTAGWGVGEIVDLSLLREQVSIEFEGLTGHKDLSFENAFKNLIPLKDDHFLARRFSFFEVLEAEAKEDPVKVIHILLRDLGPKTASEIKYELCDLVIPEDEWTKWWQSARTKLKKDTLIETPTNIRLPFRLRNAELTHNDQLRRALKATAHIDAQLEVIHKYAKQFPEIFKHEDSELFIKKHLLEMSKQSNLNASQAFEIHILFNDLFGKEPDFLMPEFMQQSKPWQEIIKAMSIAALQKRALRLIQEHRLDWVELFAAIFFCSETKSLYDTILKELSYKKTEVLLHDRLQQLRDSPTLYPEAFVWYFQKILSRDDLPFATKAGRHLFFESFLVLFHYLEQCPEYRDLLKKMYTILSSDRLTAKKNYAVVQAILADTSLEYARELLLLSTKCRSLSDHDLKIIHGLAGAIHPSLTKESEEKKKAKEREEIIWTTQTGYHQLQERIRHIATVEVIDNSKELEAARALGDLRENSEYKAAQERRAGLQGELKSLTDQLNHSRIITKEDISKSAVGIGNIVEIMNSKGEKTTYTILGRWDTNPEKKILSSESRLAKAMVGANVGDTFEHQNEKYTAMSIKSFLD